MNERLYSYYRGWLDPPFDVPVELIRCTEQTIKNIAVEFLLQEIPGAAADYLKAEPWHRLVLALDLRGVQICGQCFEVKPYTDFSRPLDVRNKCRACRSTNAQTRQEASRRWKAEARKNLSGELRSQLKKIRGLERVIAARRNRLFSSAVRRIEQKCRIASTA